MKKLDVYDPPMCCSSGVCGPTVDTKLVNFRAALKDLESRGVQVARYNPSQQQAAFAANPLVTQTVEREGMGCLPLLVVDGRIVSRGAYPDSAALLALVGVDSANPVS
jgi:hypothetical protein